MVVILAMGIGLFAPPFGDRLLHRLRDRQGGSRRGDAADLALSGALLVGLLLVAAVPWISIGFL